MPITRDFLAEGEEVLVDLRPHWVFLFGPLLLTLVAFAAAVTVNAQFPKAPRAASWLLVAMVAVPAVWLAVRLVRWAGISLIMTTQRVVLRRGILGRDLLQLRLQRIVEVHSTQTPLERLIGAGRLVMEVQGESRAVAVDDVRRPKNLQRVLTRQLDELARAEWEVADRQDTMPSPLPPPRPSRPYGVDPGSPTPPEGVPVYRRTVWGEAGAPAREAARPSVRALPGGVSEQLIQLDDLRRRGIVTTAEFEAKKAELLGRL